MPTLKQAVGLLHDFIHEVAILIKILSPTPQKGASDPSCYLWTSAGSLQVLFHDSLGQNLYWASPSLPNASITIARMAPGWTEPEWLHDYASPLLLLFPPCGRWWYSELRITCSPHSLACLVNPEERRHLSFYDLHKSTSLPHAR